MPLHKIFKESDSESEDDELPASSEHGSSKKISEDMHLGEQCVTQSLDIEQYWLTITKQFLPVVFHDRYWLLDKCKPFRFSMLV